MKKLLSLIKKQAYLLLATVISSLIGWQFFTSDSSIAEGDHVSPLPLPLPKPRFVDSSKDYQSEVRADLLVSLGFTIEQNIDARIAAVKALPDDLSAEELEMLLGFIIEYRAPTIAEGAHAYFFHELCNRLHYYPEIRPTYAAVLYQVAGDNKHDPITRDYAIQHLRRVWDKSADDQSLRQSLQSSFWQLAAGEPGISASAMLSLHNLGIPTSPTADYSLAAVPTADFQPFLDTVLRQAPTAASTPQRMTAVRIAGDRRITAIAEQLITIVKNSSEHTLVRASAINALGRLDFNEKLSTLSPFLSNDPRLIGALAHAIESK